MKILILGPAYPLRGGIAHFNALLASELRKHHTVDTITFKRQYPSLLFPGKSQEEPSGKLHGEPAPRLLDSINPLNWWSVAREIRRRSPDLVILRYWLPFFGPCFGTITRLVKRGTHIRVLTICDNVLPHERHLFDTTFTRYALAPVDCFIVQSDAVERDLLKFWPQAVYRNVPHPVYSIFGEAVPKDRARRELGLTADRIILFFGYVRKYKGLHVLLDAMASLDRTLGVHLVVAGEFYDDEQPYREQIARLNIDRSVTIHSAYLPSERVALYFSAADAVILPYLSATQSGIAQIAFNFDRPVIATTVGGLGEVIRENITGLLAPPEDPLALRDRIETFYREAREQTLVEGVRAEKGKYSWDNLVQAIEELTHAKA